MQKIKAIDTIYNGYRFRSRLEARWAVFFDTVKIRYEYEKEGYDLGKGLYYLPDFWLPDLELFVEIKGQDPTEEENKKATLLARLSGNDVVILGAIPRFLIVWMLIAILVMSFSAVIGSRKIGESTGIPI